MSGAFEDRPEARIERSAPARAQASSAKRRPITVLLVEDNPGDRKLAEEMLSQAAMGPFLVIHAERISEALQRLREHHIDAVLLDLELPDSGGMESFARVQRAAPQLPVVILTGLDDEQFALRAVRAGAEDYLVKGRVGPDELGRVLRHACERKTRRKLRESAAAAPKRKRGRVVAFLGAKGGSGVTTVALNVAVRLAASGKTAIAAEIRPQRGTLAMLAGHTRPIAHLGPLLSRPVDTIDEAGVLSCLTRAGAHLSFLFGPPPGRETRRVEGGAAGRIVEALAGQADFVVLDLAPWPDEALRECLRRAAFIGLVLEREESSLVAARQWRETLKAWGVTGFLGLVATQRTPLACPVELERMSRELGRPVVESIPPAPDSCAMAAKAGKPVIELYEEALVSAGLRALADQLAAESLTALKSA